MTSKIKIRIEAVSDIIASLGIILIFAVILSGAKFDFRRVNAEKVIVETKGASPLEATATLSGSINPNSNEIISRGFEWGDSINYAKNAEDQSILQPQFKNSWQMPIKPVAVALNSDGSFAVLNTEENKLVTFDVNGNKKAEIGGETGTGSYQFNLPQAVTYASNGNLLVADTQNNRVQIFNSDLAYTGTIADSSLAKPISLHIGLDDKLYVLDSQNSRVLRFSSDYSPDAIIAQEKVSEPTSVSVDSRSNIYISDKNGVQKFNQNGDFVKQIESEKFNSLALNSKDEIYAINDTGKIKIFSNSGELLTEFAGTGTANGLFNNPKSISTNQTDSLIVADTDNSRVQIFSKADPSIQTDFTMTVSELACSSDYHYRAFAKTAEGTFYGNDSVFTTLPCGMRSLSAFNAMAMTIQTNDPTGVGSFSATFNGDVSASTSPITKRGFEWGTSASFGSFIAGETTEASRKISPDTTGWPVSSNQPTGIAVDSNSQKVYVSDPNNNLIKIYNFDGTPSSPATYNPGILNNPNGLAIDSSGKLYIADSGNDRILVVYPDLSTASIGGPGINPENLSNPQGVALDTFGNIYVADTNNHKIKRYMSSFTYDASGSFGSNGSGSGQFISPLGITIAQSDSNKIIVADTGNNRYQVFEQNFSAPNNLTPTTTASLIVDGSASGTAFNSPSSVVTDVKNNVYVADSGNHRIVIFRPDGTFTSTYGSIADFNSPYGVATYTLPNSNPINNDSLLFVTDQNNSQVEKFFTQGEFSPTAFSNTVDFLNCGTTYYYRAVAANSDGNYVGDTKSFNTNACNTNITVTTLPPSNTTGAFATLNGSVTSIGDANLRAQGFQWGSSTAYGNTADIQSGTASGAAYLDLATQWNSTVNTPIDTATDSEGNVYISDYGNNKIKKFNNNGGFITEWSVTEPKGIGIRLNYIWVVNQAGISKYQKDGTFIFTATEGIGATDVTADNSENMYATYPEGYVKVISAGGSLMNVWGNHDGDPYYNLGYSPTGIDLYDYGSYVVIYVADTTKNRIIKYSGPDGNSGGTISSFGSEKGKLILPGFLTISQTNEDVFVTDSTGSLSKFDAVGTQTYYKQIINDMSYGQSMNTITSGVAIDSKGNVFTTSTTGNLVKKFYQRPIYLAAGSFSRVIGNLNCGSTYYYRAYANNGTTSFFGPNQTINTTSCSLIPSIVNPIPFGTIPIGVFTSAQPGGGAGNIPGLGTINPGGGRSGVRAAIDNALSGILNITKRVPRDVAVAIPFLLILVILFFALIYAIQSYRELKSTERYNTLIEKYDNLQFGSKNFISLTNHYLNTPISIMQLSAELMLSAGIITKLKSDEITSLIHNITDSVHKLLEKNTKTTEQFMAEINPEILQRKIRKASFNPLAWIPIIIAGLLVLLANLLFLRADVFKFNFASLAVQIGLFILSALFILLAWRSLIKNREIRKQRAVTLEKEKELAKYKINFINEASSSIDKNIDQIKVIADEFKGKEQAKSFLRGVAMLSGVQKSFELLKKFSSFSPTGSIDEGDVSDVLSKILERQATVVTRKNLKIKTNISNELNMRLDKSALILLLGSTINNAVKFSRDNSTINLKIENKIQSTKISITDQGIGIPKDKIDQLMMPFTRASDAMHYDYEGLGLGLYLDRIIIEQVGGSIKISSELGKGTTVEFNVPKSLRSKSTVVKSPSSSNPQIKPA